MRLPRSLDELDGLRAARWVRESTRGQYDTFGPEAQREQQDRVIERYGLIDSGISWTVAHSGRTIGATMQFMDMLARAGSDYDVLVVGYVSRFARDLRTAVNARHDLHRAGAAILFADERVLTSDEDAWELFAREAVEAEAYSRRLSKRIREGYAAKFRRLGDQGGNAPLGFRRDGPAHTLVIDPATVGRAVSIFERYAQGDASYEDVAAEFGLAPDHVRAILDNPIYNGWVRRYRRSRQEQRVAAPWRVKPPVSDELWERVHQIRARRLRGAYQKARGFDPLGGLLWCRCGRRVRANGTAGNPPRRQRIHPRTDCPEWGEYRTTWAATHDVPLAAQVAGLKINEATIERVVRALGEPEAPAPPSIDVLRLERQRRELALAHAAGRVDDQTYLTQMAELRRVEPAQTEAPVPAQEAVHFLRNIRQAWELADDEARAGVLRAIYDRLVVTREGFVEAHLTPHAYRHGLALALPETVVVRPAGVARAPSVRVRIPIVGRREWATAARRSA